MTWFVINVLPSLILFTIFTALALYVAKMRRASKWVKAHNGILIGSEEFFKWCHENGIDPSLFI